MRVKYDYIGLSFQPVFDSDLRTFLGSRVQLQMAVHESFFYFHPPGESAHRTNDNVTITLKTFQDDTYKLHRLDSSPSHKVTLTRDDLLSYYYDMNVIREMEETAKDLYQTTYPNKKKYIRGFLHLSVGQVRGLSHARTFFF